MKIITLQDFINEQYTPVKLILEGGAAGHMMHPFDDNDLTFGDLKNIIQSALKGGLNFETEPVEKTDGQNLFVTVTENGVMFARNKGQMINPISKDQLILQFSDHVSDLVRDTFTFAAKDLDKSLSKLRDISIFNNGKSFLNIELIYSKNPNVIYYDRDVIQFHGMVNTDGNGNTISFDNKVASNLISILKKLEANVQDTFTLIPPQVIKLSKDIDFEKRIPYYFTKVNTLQQRYNLSDNDSVMLYHENWWLDEIEKLYGKLPENLSRGLMLRWAYNDKQTLNIRTLKEYVGEDVEKDIRTLDKNIRIKQKENIKPFEMIFLELGVEVLKNASNFIASNPDEEMQRLQKSLKDAADNIKITGELNQIEKVEQELIRLQAIGGFESIIPTEGIVFQYRGKTYKLTGAFSAINQLLGIIKYGR